MFFYLCSQILNDCIINQPFLSLVQKSPRLKNITYRGLVHCKCFDHKNYRYWKLRGPCRETLHYLWKRTVRIAGKPVIIIGSVIIMGFPCNSYSPFPQLVQIFPAGTRQFQVPVVFMVKTLVVYVFLNSEKCNLMILETSPSSSILTLCLLFDFPVTCCLVSKLLFAKGKGQAIYHTVLQGYALLGFKSNPVLDQMQSQQS